MIEVSQIRKNYGKKEVLKDISFQAKSGECVAIIGSNGSGKSTLLQILAGVMKADSGEVRYFSQLAGNDRTIYQKFCGYVSQENPLIEELTVKDNLRLWNGRKAVYHEDFLKQFQLQDLLKTPVEKLSGGMKRRLSIACAFQNHPPILLLDEPTTALDLYYKGEIQKWLSKFRQLNGIVVMTTHDESEIMAADRCLLMKDGMLKELDKETLSINTIKGIL